MITIALKQFTYRIVTLIIDYVNGTNPQRRPQSENKEANMTVTATAFKTIGLGCIEGDTHTNEAQRVEDNGTYYEVVVHENRTIRYTKKAWVLTIKE